MTSIILHIGTPKTGTTAIQSVLADNETVLQQSDITFLKTGRHRAAHNDLANAIRRKRFDAKFKASFEEEVATEISLRPSGKILLSSEIFSLIDAVKIRDALRFLSDHSLKIVVYFRRQDRYAEAFFKQRIKNGRSIMPFEQFLNSRMGLKITDYNAILKDWADAFPNAEIVPRLYERDRFVDGDVVADFTALLGLSSTQLAMGEIQRNVSPSKDVIDIMLALSPHLDSKQLRNLYQAMKSQQLEGFNASGDLFTRETRLKYLDRFLQANEEMRKIYFPKDKQLFGEGDPKGDDTSPVGLTQVQKNLLSAALREAFKQHQEL